MCSMMVDINDTENHNVYHTQYIEIISHEKSLRYV